MPPTSAGLARRPEISRDCTTGSRLGQAGSLLPNIWKLFQTPQQPYPSTAQAVYLGDVLRRGVARQNTGHTVKLEFWVSTE